MKKRQLLASALALIMLAACLAGCGKGGGGSQTPGGSGAGSSPGNSGAGKDTLTVAFSSEPPSLTTCEHDSLISVGFNMMTYNGLTRIDNATLEAVLDLASDYRVENDVDWIFTLKQGVKFHNGDELTADDVVASLEAAKANPSSVNYTKNWQSIEAVDPYTVKITTPQPYANVLEDLGFHFNWILPKSLLDSGHNFNEEPVGTGPYKLVNWTSGTSLTFEAFDDYFDTERAAKIKNIEFRIIPEGASRTMALEAGEVDFIWELNAADAANILANSKVKLEEVNSVDNVILFLNNDTKFQDPNLRRAIAAAINRQDIIDGALGGYGLVNYTSISQGYADSTDKDQIEYNVDKAKEYMAAWGGDPSTVQMEILVSNEVRVAIATIIQANLAQIGIEVKVTQLDTATYFDRWETGNYDAVIASWSPANDLTYINRYSVTRRQQYPGSYNNPEMDTMIGQASSTLDKDARVGLIQNIVATVNQDAPQISLYQSVWLRAHDVKLQGVTLSGTGYTCWNEMYWAD